MSQISLASLARRLVVGLVGRWPTADEQDWLIRWRPAGVILFGRNVVDADQLASLCQHLHELVPGLEIVADHEGGAVSQLAAAVGRPPAAWALGELDDPDLTRRVFAQTGRMSRRLGIDRLLAPCADVLTQRHNPVIGSRAFGSEEELVGRHVTAAVQGFADSDMAACLKHWPGHGGSRSDSHLALARVGSGARSAPFLAGLKAGVEAVMVGHLRPDSSDANAAGDSRVVDLPATLDEGMLSRDRAELAGARDGEILFYADDVTMGALGAAMVSLGAIEPSELPDGMVDPGTLPADWLIALVRAGCDRLLIRGIPWRAFEEELPGPISEPVSQPGQHEAARDPGSAVEPVVEQDAYAEARSRLRNLNDLDSFATGESTLVWVDFTEGDRWEVGAESETFRTEALASALGRDFEKIIRVDGGGADFPEQVENCSRLLVTSHRPFATGFGAEPGLLERLDSLLATGGRCLTMGHPSLAGEVAARLGPEWRLSSLYDIDAEDYVDERQSG